MSKDKEFEMFIDWAKSELEKEARIMKKSVDLKKSFSLSFKISFEKKSNKINIEAGFKNK